MTKLTGQQIADEDLAGWALLLGGLHTRLRTGTFATGRALVDAIGEAAENLNHTAELTLRPDHVEIRLTTPEERGVTDRDVRLARTVTTLAREAGVALDSDAVSGLELALDTPSQETVLPFWSAVLAMNPLSGQDIGAPSLPTVWFQHSGSEEPRQRWHLDVWVDPAQIQPRIAAALAAGGTLVSDAMAPSFWILADPEGNNVCLCTWQNRDQAAGD